MNPYVAHQPGADRAMPLGQPPLAVVLRLETPGVALAREPVRADDLADHVAEAWREGCLRQGRPDVPLAGLPVRVTPRLKHDHGPACPGFALELSLPDGHHPATDFTIFSLDAVARRAARRLLATGKLQPGQQYYYEVQFLRATAEVSPPPAEATAFDVSDRSPALSWLQVPLRPLLQSGTPQNRLDEASFQVCFTAAAWRRAEQCARQGANASPPVETGAVLVGTLCSCPDTGDFFVVVTDAYEVLEAEQKVFSLTYTSQSWRRLQSVLKARQAGCPALRLLGQAHGHNFLPAGGQTCQDCLSRPVCGLTNLYVSEDDQNWTRAVFAGAPYSLCAIFGFSARNEPVQGLFTQHDARLRQRGYFVIPDFKPEQWECRAAAKSP